MADEKDDQCFVFLQGYLAENRMSTSRRRILVLPKSREAYDKSVGHNDHNVCALVCRRMQGDVNLTVLDECVRYTDLSASNCARANLRHDPTPRSTTHYNFGNQDASYYGLDEHSVQFHPYEGHKLSSVVFPVCVTVKMGVKDIRSIPSRCLVTNAVVIPEGYKSVREEVEAEIAGNPKAEVVDEVVSHEEVLALGMLKGNLVKRLVEKVLDLI
ncbi:hypothetical protein BT96DRAFT_986394 [Gymnopus androsaceus JB14]|uniref:Uncharacterized protein n=1 Tax=Gymnopus androsaceus JB14 TaxID=1447944 RepID=A0A6A4IB19_9AGAR|nr:hypothetical protein BT96DRAFT_986394 [Gymnopus androsaceus JB14]